MPESFLPPRALRPVKLRRALAQALLSALMGMTFFEVTKQFLHPAINIWQSHLITILFSSIIATAIAFYVWRRQEQFQRQLFVEIRERQKTEEKLQHLYEELETRLQERTAALAKANVTLQTQIAAHERMEQDVSGTSASPLRNLPTLAAAPTLRPYFAHVLTVLVEHFHVFSSALYFYDPEHHLIRLHMQHWDGRIRQEGEGPEAPPDLSPPSAVPGHPLVQTLNQIQAPLVIDRAVENPLSSPALRSWMARLGIESILIIPLILDGKLLGMLSVRSQEPRRFSTQEIELASMLAQQATLALQITHLTEQGKRAAIVEERNRLAREIHDTLSQGFTGIIMQLEGAEDLLDDESLDRDTLRSHLVRAGGLARRSLAEARRSVWELRPSLLEINDLASALARTLEQMTAGTDVQTAFALRGTPQPLPALLADHLFRIGQEAVSNALLHARARAIQVALTFEHQHVTLEVKDDGQGFDVQERTTKGFGLLSMRERTNRISGHLTVLGQSGQGTRLRVVAPIPMTRRAEVVHEERGKDESNPCLDRR